MPVAISILRKYAVSRGYTRIKRGADFSIVVQIDSPCLHDFWAEHRGHNEIPGQQDDGGFHRAQLSTNRAERRTHPGIVTMEKNGIEIVAPNVNLSALKHLEYRTFVREVLEANKSKIITLPDMQLLWDTIVYEMFGFECSCVKESRANDVFTLISEDLVDLLTIDTR